MTGIVQTLIGGFGAVAAAVTDAYFNLVTLLLPGNGTNGAQNNTFLDSSTNNFTITRNGNTTQGTFSPFSQTGWSNFFDGSANYRLTIPDSTDLDLTGDFCFEGWVYFSSLSVAQQIVCIGSENSAQNGFVVYLSNSSGIVTFYSNGAAVINTSGVFTANEWQHIAVVRSGSGSNNLVIYRNGVSVGTATNTTSFTGLAGNGLCIGQTYTTSYISSYTGYISNVRLVKGSPVYTGSFTPSTTPLTPITNTVLLTCQSNRFIDTNTQVAAKTITVTGSPSVQPFSPFAPTAAYSAATNGGSGYFDGTGDYLSVGTAADWTFLHNTTAAWTMEFWVYNTTTGSATTLLDTNASTTGSTGVTVQKTASEFINVFITYSSAGNNIVNGTSNITLKANAWNHVFISYNQSLANTNLVFYINGAAAGTANKTANTPSSGNPANALSIATYGAGAGQFFPGYIGSLRISNTVRSTPSSVPTSPYTSDANTKLLANFTNAGITDATAKNDLETVGGAQISTTQSKFGGSSVSFNGTNSYLRPNSGNIFNFGTGDFTIEFWLYLNSTAAQMALIDCRPGSAGDYILFDYDPTAKLRLFVNTTTVLSGSTLATGQWYHIALARSGSTVRYFIDGTQGASATMTTNLLSAANPYIGSNYVPGSYLNGYIDDLRVTKGYARYTANFTPPTAAFALQ